MPPKGMRTFQTKKDAEQYIQDRRDDMATALPG
jgi:hypothetical protein